MKVLLAVDYFPESRVVDAVLRLPWPSGTIFCVMRVVDMRQWEGLPQLIRDAQHQAEQVVESATKKLTQSGYRVFSEITAGSPKEAITDYAKEWNADLVMTGSHGQDMTTRFLLGSVAQAVLRTAPCAVEIVRPPRIAQSSSRGMNILLATDGSEYSVQAAAVIAERPWPAQSAIRILSAAHLVTKDVPSLAASLHHPAPLQVDEARQQSLDRAREAIAGARETLRTTALNISEATPVGEPRAAILDEAKSWPANLIVLGSLGNDCLKRHGIGSVAETVALYADCSVEVVR